MAVVESKKKKPTKETPKKEEDRVDEQIMEPGKYEVTDETTFEVKIYLKEHNGRWVVWAAPEKDVDEHKLVFRMWNYDEMVEMKKKATSYDTTRRVHIIDNDSLNRLKIQKFLQSWTMDKDNPRLKIHRVQGVLTDESWKMFTKLQPNILNYIFDKMNEVYELNG